MPDAPTLSAAEWERRCVAAVRDRSPGGAPTAARNRALLDSASSEADGVPRCDACGLAATYDWINPAFALAVRRCDISYTYDGYCIVSKRFRQVLGDHGAIYRDLPAEPGFFALYADEVVAFDAERRGTQFDHFCDWCGRYTQVAGATPVFLVSRDPLPEAVVRTDIEFGSNDERSPLLLVGRNVAASLRAADLAGLDLLTVADPLT